MCPDLIGVIPGAFAVDKQVEVNDNPAIDSWCTTEELVMPIRFQCPNCQKSYTLESYTLGDESAGRTAICSKCDSKLAIPKLSDLPIALRNFGVILVVYHLASILVLFVAWIYSVSIAIEGMNSSARIVIGPYLDYLKARVRADMDRPMTWSAVERVAEALLENEEFSARKVREIIKSIWKIPKRS